MTILEDFESIASNSDATFAMIATVNKNIRVVAERLYKHTNHKNTTHANYKIKISRFEFDEKLSKYHIVKGDNDYMSYIYISVPKSPVKTTAGKFPYTIEDIENNIRTELKKITSRWNTTGNPVAVPNRFFEYNGMSTYWGRY